MLVTATLTQLLHDILTSRVYDVARETPLDPAPRLSRRLGNEVLLKREDLQPVFSFKLRGAYNRIAHLTDDERARGIITASAGNHAQGVAFSARKLGLRAVIVMPQTTPQIKVDAVRAMGAEVVLSGDSYADAQAHCDTLVAETGMTFIHPFDDPLVIAGQGTIGDEILRHSQDRLSAVFVPVGGGGLIAGIAGYIKALRPEVKVIGVEPFEADAMYQSLAGGPPRAARSRGHLRRRRRGARGRRADVPDRAADGRRDRARHQRRDLRGDQGHLRRHAHGDGAGGRAGGRRAEDVGGARRALRDQSLVAVLSGANMNFDRLRFVAERAEVGEAREALLAVTIPERPGAFREFCAAHRPPRRHRVQLPAERPGRRRTSSSASPPSRGRTAPRSPPCSTRAGYETVDLTDNEMAKLHVRHMVGGRAPDVRHERLCRFEFPERPGALTQFLDKLGGRWNISLFHYRNHGADFGRVLAGFEVADADLPAFRAFLDELGYPYTLEPDNPAYRFFLS